jgi:hypothetical protein
MEETSTNTPSKTFPSSSANDIDWLWTENIDRKIEAKYRDPVNIKNYRTRARVESTYNRFSH